MIVNAAIRYPDGKVRVAKRHYKIMMAAAKEGIKSYDGEQGFVTDKGKFLTRSQAKLHALDCQQISPFHYGTLHSEDLWEDE